MDREEMEATGRATPKRRITIGVSLVLGFVLGVCVTGAAVWTFMPGMMIVTQESRLGFDDTVATLERAIAANGWASPGTMDLNASLAKQGVDFPSRVRIVKLCRADYAADVLRTDRHVSCLMPCSIAVWEDDGGAVRMSKLNTGLMGKLFGGNVARVMGRLVAADEEKILDAVLGG